MKRQKILVLAKACPVKSKKYIETVCVAGLTESGKMIRLYPVSSYELKKSDGVGNIYLATRKLEN